MPETFAVTPSFATLWAFDLGNVFTQLGFVAAALTILSFMLTDFLRSIGTAMAIG